MKDHEDRPLALVILDGWGISPSAHGNAIALAHTPYYNDICSKYPWTRLAASGTAVGLEANQSGNAELGHRNIGTGRVVQTDMARIANAIRSGSFFENGILRSALGRARDAGSTVHLVGLLSDGDVHSSPETLYALLRMAKLEGARNVVVHCILDGRDVPIRTADVYAEALEIKLADIGIGRIASICGRFFAMDNSGNWDRTARAYTMLVHGEGERATDPVAAIRSSFQRGIGDEFTAPIVIATQTGSPAAMIRNGDTVVFFNHRPDTMRQLVRSIAIPEPAGDPSSKPQINVVCLTEYDPSFHLPVAFPPASEQNILGEVLVYSNVHNYRISEIDRFMHVTRFFNGGYDLAGPNEMHVLVGSSDKLDREAEPEMQCFKITDALLKGIEADRGGVFVVNIPAPGLVAETGNLDRTVEAVQYTDTCLGGIAETILEFDGTLFITSTHGNCESMLTSEGGPDRFATNNPVPFHVIGKRAIGPGLKPVGALQDVAPTLLSVLGIDKPSEMSGSVLFSE
jgi:2,3-bisphosphoglycerate-independent phosphoglycerate mutase